ncbi:MAG: hypothetical protein EXS48_01655 [Candidatus Staskawiczbacteria bacterium]|nr:hypothetical protein [Candidatus Staskawiczbacteria bacterium]
MCIDTQYIRDLEKEYYRSLKKYSIKEWADIFPEASEVLREKIIETTEDIGSALARIENSYHHSLREPEIAPICEATAEIIFESELVPLKRRLKRLTYQHYILTGKKQDKEKIDIESLKERIDLKSIIEEYGIRLRKSGKSWLGLCPFHNEKNPSFSVSAKYFHCFGCQKSGDVFSFVQEIEGVDFKEALNKLKVYA